MQRLKASIDAATMRRVVPNQRFQGCGSLPNVFHDCTRSTLVLVRCYSNSGQTPRLLSLQKQTTR